MLTLSQIYKSPSAFLSALLAAGLSLADVRPGSNCDPLCKSVPGSAGWPSTETWARLNESTGGRLLRPSPPGAVCHPGQPAFDNTTCGGVKAGWTSYEFHDADPVSVDWNQYSNDSCLPDPHYPCSGQGYPVFVINATTAEHVKLGVDFAREHHVRLVVKSSGHDFIGRSIAPNSLSIWTHHMTGLQTHESFQPKSCKVTIDGGAVTAGAGSAMAELYGALSAINRTVIGGGGKTVSLGGYLTGGGHSLLSSRHGLATDQVLEMEVVTPQGQILTINECSHEDLFWAMRGGGGSTFAIMTSVTMKTFPSPRLACGDIIIATAANSSLAKSVPDLAGYVVSQFPDLGDAGMSGYSYILRDFPNPYDPSSGPIAGFYASMCIQDTQDTTEFLKLWSPIFKHINETWAGFLIVPNLSNFTSFSGWYAVNYDKSTTGTDTYVGSRLLDKKALTSNVTALAAALDRLSSGGTATAYLVSGKGVRDAKPRGGGDAVNPAWRKAYVHSTFGVDFEPLNASAKAEALQKINYLLEPMRKLAPDMGAYMNEANPEEPDWQRQFWGDHYERLVKIKRSVDPQDVLWCTPCVGNKRWKEHDGMLCRV